MSVVTENQPDGTPTWIDLATADCNATALAVRRAGGTVVDPPTDVMEQGRMAIMRDAAGGTAGPVSDMVYGRQARITDPFGAEFSIIARPA